MNTGPISHDEALQIAKRFIDGHFGNPGDHPRASIPADPSRDDDIRLIAYIDQQRASHSAAPDAALEGGFEWAMVEIFGHRRHAGRAMEVEKFGGKLLRIDVPKYAEDGSCTWTTHCYGGGSIFSYTPTDEATVRRVNAPVKPFTYSLGHEGDDE